MAAHGLAALGTPLDLACSRILAALVCGDTLVFANLPRFRVFFGLPLVAVLGVLPLIRPAHSAHLCLIVVSGYLLADDCSIGRAILEVNRKNDNITKKISMRFFYKFINEPIDKCIVMPIMNA